MIVLVTGDYGVGKDTFANMLLTHLGIDKAQLVRSYTTREKRYDDEITHTFVTHDDYHKVEDKDKVAETCINGEYYWTTKQQFARFSNGFSVYVVDDAGIEQVIKSGIDEVYIIEVIRPSWLVNVDEERVNREKPHTDFKYHVQYRVINDKTFEYLDRVADDVATALLLDWKQTHGFRIDDHDLYPEYMMNEKFRCEDGQIIPRGD